MSGQGRIVSQLGEGMTDTETSRGAWEACLHGQNLVEAFLAVVFIVELMLQFFVWGPSGLRNFGISLSKLLKY